MARPRGRRPGAADRAAPRPSPGNRRGGVEGAVYLLRRHHRCSRAGKVVAATLLLLWLMPWIEGGMYM